MIYPLIEDYKDSFRNPENYFDTLKPLYPVQAPWDNKQPYFASGGFATVFKLKDKNQKYWAFKCFTQEVKDRKERLQAIATHLQQLKSPYFVDFKYMEKELWVCSEKAGDQEQPIVVMEWIEGKILGKFIEEKVKENDRNALFQTLQKFVQMSEYLLQNGIAHGDLKHDNIFVKQNGDLVLIDYDGMFVPALWDKPMIEAGSPSYQHPQRPQAPFNNQLDHFSMLVIVIDLYALYLNPALRNALKDSDSLLIQQNDLQNPAQSPLFAQLNQLKDTFLNQMLLELKRSLANQQIYVVGLGNIIKEVKEIEYQDKIIAIPTNTLTLEWWHNLDEKWQKALYAHVKLWKEKGILLTEDFLEEKQEQGILYYDDTIYNICKKMNVDTGQIRVDNYFLDNLLALPVLYCYHLYITDITVLKELKNLTNLNLGRNQITDFTILKDLKNLTSLNLKQNEITDITALKELKNLTSLDLGFNQITDITILKELKNLTSLDLAGNQITDFTILRELKNLTSLRLSGNKITDISILKDLKNLTSLDLYNNRITDITALKDLKNLTSLDLYQNQIIDFTILRELKNLTSLRLSGNKITDISILKELKNLTSLRLSGNKITDISILKELKNLTSLDVDSQITDISILKELKNLTSLTLLSNKITDISILKELKNLTNLNVLFSQITDISPLRELKNLTNLNVLVCQITDISPLRELKNLTNLNLQRNKISDITALKDLKNLTRLALDDNQITDITALKELKNLTRLNLSSNQIIDNQKQILKNALPNCSISF